MEGRDSRRRESGPLQMVEANKANDRKFGLVNILANVLHNRGSYVSVGGGTSTEDHFNPKPLI